MKDFHGTDIGDAAFSPSSIALVGASSDARRPAGRPLRFLRQAGFAGRIYPVNPNRPEIDGHRVWPALTDLPEAPEHVYVLLGTGHVADAVAEAAAMGTRVITVLADGFAERGAQGAAQQARLAAVAQEHGARLIGPNSMGLADLHSGAWITVNAVFNEADQIAGRTALISQSGSMIGGLVSRSRPLGLGFSRVAAVGNEADLGIAELGLAAVADPNTDVVLLFLETIRDAAGLAALAHAAHTAGKPVVAYKTGRSEVGGRLAVAHTGALMAEDAVADALLRDIGIARVQTLDALIEAPVLFRGQKAPARPRRRVGILTTTGGGAGAVADNLALAGLDVVPASEETAQAIRATGLDIVASVVTDLTMAGATAPFVQPSVEAMAADPGFDFVVKVAGSSARYSHANAIDPIIAARGTAGRIGVVAIPEAGDGLRKLIEHGVPAFRTPESCSDAVAAYLRWTAPRISGPALPPGTPPARALDEPSSRALFTGLGIETVPALIASAAAPPDRLPFPFPVVVKAISQHLPHKTEAGGVVTGIPDAEALRTAISDMLATVAERTGIAIDEVLIAPHLSPVQEVLVGYARDPVAGPVITLAPGGILVELTGQKALRMAPVDETEAMAMIDSLSALSPLRGYRGRPAGDVAALARLVAALSRTALTHPQVVEAEANPVMVLPDGALAADALVTVAEE